MPTGIDKVKEQASTVWANLWNPPTDKWAPSDEPHDVFADLTGEWGEPGHGDIPEATPVSEEPYDEDHGTTSRTGMNLLDAVRDRAATEAPESIVHHYMETIEHASDLVRGRVVRVTGNNNPTPLLDENPDRNRALIKVITAGSTIMVQPARQGGNQANVAAPTGNQAGYPQATGDPVMIIEATAAVEAYGTTVGAAVDVAIWEELNGTGNVPGLT